MSRRRLIHRADALAERVASGFLGDDLDRAKEQALSEFFRRSLNRALSDEARSVDEIAHLARGALWKLRQDLRTRSSLVSYYTDGDQLPPDRCCGCTAVMEAPPPGHRGPRRKHCDGACRQMAYRNRKRLRADTGVQA